MRHVLKHKFDIQYLKMFRTISKQTLDIQLLNFVSRQRFDIQHLKGSTSFWNKHWTSNMWNKFRTNRENNLTSNMWTHRNANLFYIQYLKTISNKRLTSNMWSLSRKQNVASNMWTMSRNKSLTYVSNKNVIWYFNQFQNDLLTSCMRNSFEHVSNKSKTIPNAWLTNTEHVSNIHFKHVSTSFKTVSTTS